MNEAMLPVKRDVRRSFNRAARTYDEAAFLQREVCARLVEHLEPMRLSPRRLKVVLDHGAKRQIRVMFEQLGYQVTKLMRVRIGGLWLGDLEPGRFAVLNHNEIAMLMGAAEEKPKPRKKRPD